MARATQRHTKRERAAPAKTAVDVRRGADATSASDDPVVALGIELERVRARHGFLENESAKETEKHGSAALYREVEVEHAEDRMAALREYICAVEATSPQGALVQIAIALIELDGASGEDLDPSVERQLRKIKRLLYSAGCALEGTIGKGAFAPPFTDNINPWINYELRLASIATLIREAV